MTELTHISEDGTAQMVDITAKHVTERFAVAEGWIRMTNETLEMITGGRAPKGDVLAVARLAGIMAAKRTADLIPMCHQIPLSDVKMVIAPDHSLPGLRAEASVRTVAGTGVEMEAITAVSIALVTVYDMAKAIDRAMEITDIRLVQKSGGRSGDWHRSGGTAIAP